jgi:hypothetical protein
MTHNSAAVATSVLLVVGVAACTGPRSPDEAREGGAPSAPVESAEASVCSGDRISCDVPDFSMLDSGPAVTINVNRELILKAAESRPDALAIDQLPDFLGHGNNADTHGCPYCGSDNTQWISDTLHPNAIGNRHIAEKWYRALASVTGPACSRDR